MEKVHFSACCCLPSICIFPGSAGARARCTPQLQHGRHKMQLLPRMLLTKTVQTSALAINASENETCVSITLKDLQKAHSTLTEFYRYYLMFHDMNGQNARDILKHFPILAVVEGYAYQIDEQYEKLLIIRNTTSQQKDDDPNFQNELAKSDAFLKVQEKNFQKFHHIIASQNLWTTRIEEVLKNGFKYWSLEQSLCDCLQLDKEILVSDVMEAMKFKSFNIRILNLLLYGLSNQPVNETHMEFLSVAELFREIVDDLLDYEEDVLNNSFNILRMFTKIYGPARAPYMLGQVILEIEENYKKLLETLEPSLALQYQKCRKEIVSEGGGNISSIHPMGPWKIPTLILNERVYREKIAIEAT